MTFQKGHKINNNKKLTNEHRLKLSLAHKWKKSWNKGLPKEMQPMYGKKLLEETKKRMSLSKKGHLAWNKGRKWNDDVKRKMSEAHKGKKIGNKSSLWQGGKSFESLPKGYGSQGYREKIRQRDDFRCQECFKHQSELFTKTGKKVRLDVHHIDYDKSNNNSENLISLCKNCHNQTDFNRNGWIEYFRNKRNKGVSYDN